MPCAGLESACGCSKHRLVYERALLLGHAREQLLPLPVTLLCCLCGLALPEVFLQVHKSMLRSVHRVPCTVPCVAISSHVMCQEASRTFPLISKEACMILESLVLVTSGTM